MHSEVANAHRPVNSWLLLDTARLVRNIEAVIAAAGDPDRVIFVVKADGYGHGLQDAARCAWEAGVRRFAVAHLFEARALRAILPDVWILVLGVVMPHELEEAVSLRVVCILASAQHAMDVARAATEADLSLECHLKVDTGMGRLGIPVVDLDAMLAELVAQPGLRVTGMCTHFAYTRPHDVAHSREQLHALQPGIVRLGELLGAPPMVHAANTDAFVHAKDLGCDAVRIGLLGYGYAGDGAARQVETEPCLKWCSRVLQVKRIPKGHGVGYDCTHVAESDTRVATLDVGYADGYMRALSNRGDVLIGGRRCPVLGRVSMNLTTVAVPEDLSVAPGDEVVLLGRDGSEGVTACELAERADTIPYEILTSIRPGERAQM